MDYKVEILARKNCYQGFLSVEKYQLRHRKFNGDMSPPIYREVMERGNAAVLLPYDPRRDEVVLIEQFRLPHYLRGRGGWSLECVAGVVKEGESMEEVARREAMEEAGLLLEKIEKIGEILPSPGGNTEVFQLFWAKIDSKNAGGVFGLPEEHEDIRVHVLPYAEVAEGLQTMRFDIAPTLILLYWLKDNRERLRQLYN